MMSILSMVVSTVKSPNKKVTLTYNKKSWSGNLNLSGFDFHTFNDVNNYLKNNYDKVHYLRIDVAKTFAGDFIKPKDIYAEETKNGSEPNCIMVEKNNILKLVVVKAKRAKEFVAFTSSAKNTYVPLFVYKNENGIDLINLK